MTPAKLRLAQTAMGKRGAAVADLCRGLTKEGFGDKVATTEVGCCRRQHRGRNKSRQNGKQHEAFHPDIPFRNKMAALRVLAQGARRTRRLHALRGLIAIAPPRSPDR
jgi:hypothetical protein